MGGGSHRASASRPPTPRSPIRHYLPHPVTPAPPSSVIPAQAGTGLQPAPRRSIPAGAMHNADALPHAPASRAVQAARATIARLYLETAAHAASYPPPPRDSG